MRIVAYHSEQRKLSRGFEEGKKMCNQEVGVILGARCVKEAPRCAHKNLSPPVRRNDIGSLLVQLSFNLHTVFGRTNERARNQVSNCKDDQSLGWDGRGDSVKAAEHFTKEVILP